MSFHPVIANPVDWSINTWEDCQVVDDSWSSLLPFFEANGYKQIPPAGPEVSVVTLVDDPGDQLSQLDGPVESKHTANEVYPFARVFFRTRYKHELGFAIPTTVKAFWDRENREILIKIVHGNELKVLQYLNTPEMRANSINRTIPVLEFIAYEALTFAVMPRWGGPFGGLDADFANVRELMHACQHLFEGLVFLHDHRIVHGDIDARNTAVNAIPDPMDEHPTGLLNPSETEYVFIDFGMSSMYSLDTDMDSVAPVQPIFNFPERPLPAPPLPEYCNPFRADVYNLATCLERSVRVAQDIVPELVTFFEAHTKQDIDANPSAREMLNAFQMLNS
ncbi:hypothetical protein C8J56DRAFT_1167339 [Mycena floridula]|nr:hypothetical protein C8J56DRAFT_1167339 [Mycena floridula]